MRDWFVERGYHLYKSVKKEIPDEPGRPGHHYIMLEPTNMFEGDTQFPHAFMGGDNDSDADPARTHM